MTAFTVTARAAQFAHVYNAADAEAATSRNSIPLLKAFNRQLIDANTGLLRADWEIQLHNLIDTLNTILQRKAQG